MIDWPIYLTFPFHQHIKLLSETKYSTVVLYCTLLWQLAEAGSHANVGAGHRMESTAGGR